MQKKKKKPAWKRTLYFTSKCTNSIPVMKKKTAWKRTLYFTFKCTNSIPVIKKKTKQKSSKQQNV